ncbi:MAG: DUF2846 domain-containing protein [Desulfobacterales bacterium]|nr:DUF2846 domain-containing protein [Desulfobacterales bacterium]
MCRPTMAIICVFFVAITLSGCVGLALNIPEECKNETPYTGVHDIFWKKQKPVPKASNKEEFIKDWGKPDQIILYSENVETWIYERKLWCGVVPFLLLPVPFILPVCEGFDQIEFQGNEATRLHTRHIVSGGLVVGIPGGYYGGIDPVCRYPLPPKSSVGSDEEIITNIATFQLPKLPEKGKAIVYVVRPSPLGKITRFNVFIDNQDPESEMGYTMGGEYIYFNLTPGDHQILSKAENCAKINVSAKEGDVIFIQQESKMGTFKAKNSIFKIQDYEGKNHIKNLFLGVIIKFDR